MSDTIPSGYEAIIRQMVAELESAMLPKVYKLPDTIFHYTDSSGLLGILEKRELWATHYCCLNDPSELASGERIVESELAKLVESMVGDTLKHAFVDGVRSWYMAQPLRTLYEVFIASFSENGDDLSQWRAYGSDGFGYSIGFAIQPDSKGDIAGGLHCTLRQCVYDHGAMGNRLSNLVRHAAAGFSLYHATHTPKDERERDAIATEAMMSVLPFLAFEVLAFKNPYFRSELEWRLSVLQEIDEPGPTNRFRATPTGIVPYFPIELRRDDETIRIKKVVIGPRGDQSQRVANVKALLTRNHIEGCDVVPSEIPYRGR